MDVPYGTRIKHIRPGLHILLMTIEINVSFRSKLHIII